MIAYTLTRSNRKTIAIHITQDARLLVRAPLKAPKAEIDRFVLSKQDWITKHMAMREQTARSKEAFTLSYGDTASFRSEAYPIAIKDGNRVGFDGERFYLPPGLSEGEIKRAVVQVYKMLAKNLLTNKVIDYAKRMKVTPVSVKINSAKTHWGSCSGKNSINFTWRLVMAADDVIEYVVVHELSHIKEHNHSAAFWAAVASVLPDYKERRRGLTALAERLNKEDWE